MPPEACPGWGSSGRINSLGLRDRECDLEPTPGVFRILALGDSFTEGLQFDLDATWTKLLEARLNAREDGRTYEVINAGVSGRGTAGEYLYYANEGHRLHPDLVLVMFNDNDVYDDSPVLSYDLDRPFFRLKGGELVLDDSFLKHKDFRLKRLTEPIARVSRVYCILAQLYAKVRYSDAARQVAAAEAAQPETDGLTADERDGLKVTEALMSRLAAETHANGSRFALILSTSANQVNFTDRITWNDRSFEAETLREIVDYSARRGIPCLNLTPDFQTYALEQQAGFHGCPENGGVGHWNRTAHLLAANRIYDFLLAENLIP